MRSVKLTFLFLLAVALSAQVVPDWFVLELSEPPVGRTRGTRRVAASQAGVRAAMRARLGARVEVKEFTEVVMNSLIVRSSASESELAALPGVRKVWPVYEIHPELDRVVGLLGVTKAWESVGGSDRAGAGMKIAILDSGMDLQHPAFRGDTMTAPQDFPKATNEDIRGQLNGKVIVYRTYDKMAGLDETALDNAGHGTGVAMIAAGLKVKSPYAEIQGVAPAAWLGVYRIFVGPTGGSSNTAIAAKAIDDAAADGMDVLNISWGFLPQIRPELDPLAPSLDRAASLGIVVVKSNGNSGPARLSGSTPSIGSAGISVGASWTDRIFASGVRVNGGDAIAAVPGDGAAPAGILTAPFKDVAAFDPTGLACNPLPDGALSGAVALILRGDCTFEVKIKAAQAAGAVAAVIYTHAASPNPSIMITGTAGIPAAMISNKDGVTVKGILSNVDSVVDLSFDDTLPFITDSNGITDFSSRGPGADGSIRPDLVAVGEEILTATQKTTKNGDLYDASGFTVADGTSFSSPMVTGAYAVLKAGRPALSSAQYRSLLVNSAAPFPSNTARPAPVQIGGAGRLDLQAALTGRLALSPVSLTFGMGGQRVEQTRNLRVSNLTGNLGSWRVEIDSADDVKATVDPAEFSLGAGGTVDLKVTFSGDVPVGESQGFLLFRPVDAADGERPQRLAYWYGVPSGKPTLATFIPSPPQSATAGSTVSLTLLVTDAIGATGSFDAPTGSVLEGSGSFVDATSVESAYPGYWLVRVRVGATAGQTNRFRIQAGATVREVSILSR
jgi:minor extracellular serine protease Vpr